MTPLPSPSVSPKGTARHAPIPTAGRYGKEVYSSSGVVSPAGGGAAGGHGRDAGGAAGSALAIPQCPPLGTAGMPAPSLQSSAPAASLPEPPRLCFPRSAAGPCREMRGCAGEMRVRAGEMPAPAPCADPAHTAADTLWAGLTTAAASTVQYRTKMLFLKIQLSKKIEI